MASAEREVLARRLARELPAGFIFQAIRTFQLAESQHVVALYQRDHATFALIPGGVISLGYDSKQPWTPNADELQSWQSTSEEYGIDRTIHEYISDVTLRTRRVELSPFLIETAASELGWAPITADDPEVQNLLREFGSNRQVEVRRGGVSIRVRKDLNGNIVAERSLPQTHANLAALLAAEGFRFPTSDEWEYACGSGA
jgi:formylglycine-generating enzyme required for sulfatase activity